MKFTNMAIHKNFLKDMQLLQNRYPLSHNLATSQETQSLGFENRLIPYLHVVGCTVCSATGTSRFDEIHVKTCNSIIFPKNFWGGRLMQLAAHIVICVQQ